MQTVFKVFSTWWNALQEKWSRCWWTVSSSPLACPASSTSRGSFSTALLVKLSRCNTEENRCHEQYSRWLKSAFRTECRCFFFIQNLFQDADKLVLGYMLVFAFAFQFWDNFFLKKPILILFPFLMKRFLSTSTLCWARWIVSSSEYGFPLLGFSGDQSSMKCGRWVYKKFMYWYVLRSVYYHPKERASKFIHKVSLLHNKVGTEYLLPQH